MHILIWEMIWVFLNLYFANWEFESSILTRWSQLYSDVQSKLRCATLNYYSWLPIFYVSHLRALVPSSIRVDTSFENIAQQPTEETFRSWVSKMNSVHGTTTKSSKYENRQVLPRSVARFGGAGPHTLRTCAVCVRVCVNGFLYRPVQAVVSGRLSGTSPIARYRKGDTAFRVGEQLRNKYWQVSLVYGAEMLKVWVGTVIIRFWVRRVFQFDHPRAVAIRYLHIFASYFRSGGSASGSVHAVMVPACADGRLVCYRVVAWELVSSLSFTFGLYF